MKKTLYFLVLLVALQTSHLVAMEDQPSRDKALATFHVPHFTPFVGLCVGPHEHMHSKVAFKAILECLTMFKKTMQVAGLAHNSHPRNWPL